MSLDMNVEERAGGVGYTHSTQKVNLQDIFESKGHKQRFMVPENNTS